MCVLVFAKLLKVTVVLPSQGPSHCGTRHPASRRRFVRVCCVPACVRACVRALVARFSLSAHMSTHVCQSGRTSGGWACEPKLADERATAIDSRSNDGMRPPLGGILGELSSVSIGFFVRWKRMVIIAISAMSAALGHKFACVTEQADRHPARTLTVLARWLAGWRGSPAPLRLASPPPPPGR